MRRASILLYLHGCQACKLNFPQKTIKTGNWAYIGQPDDHIGWAKWMPFASINPTNSRTNSWNFHKKYWELASLNNSVFLSRPFCLKKRKKKRIAHENWSNLLGYHGWVKILMIFLVSSQISLSPNISAPSVKVGWPVSQKALNNVDFLNVLMKKL